MDTYTIIILVFSGIVYSILLFNYSYNYGQKIAIEEMTKIYEDDHGYKKGTFMTFLINGDQRRTVWSSDDKMWLQIKGGEETDTK